MTHARRFASTCLETIMQIVEEKPSFVLPTKIYYLAILIFFLQNAGYILSTQQIKSLDTDSKINFIAQLNEISSPTYLLFIKGSDGLTFLFFFFMQATIYFYYLYILIISCLKLLNDDGQLPYGIKAKLRIINNFLNLFFSFYWWIFFIPYIEINCGLISCRQLFKQTLVVYLIYSFLMMGSRLQLYSHYSSYKNSSFSPNRIVKHIRPSATLQFFYYLKSLHSVMGSVGLFLSLTTAILIIYLYRNYEFQELNKLKRKYSSLLFLQILLRFMLVLFYFMGLSSILTLSHTVVHILGCSAIYCCFVNWPFPNKDISRFYTICCFLFEWEMIVSSFWIFTEQLPSESLFYLLLISGTAVSAGAQVLWNLRYNQIMKLNEQNESSLYRYYDFYCEEIVAITLDCQLNPLFKYALIEFINYHRAICPGRFEAEQPYCQTLQYLDENSQIITQNVYKILDTIFQRKLAQIRVIKNQDVYERLSLKYISFLAKFCNNPYRAYFQLKRLIALNSTHTSMYFSKVSKILAQNIEKQIMQLYMSSELIGATPGLQQQQQQMQMQQLSLKSLFAIEKMKQIFLPRFADFCKHKVQLLQSLFKGFKTIEQFKEEGLLLARQGLQIKEDFRSTAQELAWEKNNAAFFKMWALFNALILNEVINTKQQEDTFVDLLRRDAAKPIDLLHNANLVKNNIVCLTISLVKEPQHIVGSVTPQQARFFRYLPKNFQQTVNSIVKLMPSFLAPHHHTFLSGFVQRGYSNLIQSSHRTFALDGRGFIFPINIQISHVFTSADDFLINGTILRIDISDGLILFDEHGNFLGVNRQAYSLMFRKHSKAITLLQNYRGTIAGQNIIQNNRRSFTQLSQPQPAANDNSNMNASQYTKNKPNNKVSSIQSLSHHQSQISKDPSVGQGGGGVIKSEKQIYQLSQEGSGNAQIASGPPDLKIIMGQLQQQYLMYLMFPKLAKVLSEMQDNLHQQEILNQLLLTEQNESKGRGVCEVNNKAKELLKEPPVSKEQVPLEKQPLIAKNQCVGNKNEDKYKTHQQQLIAPNQFGRFKLPKNISHLTQSFNQTVLAESAEEVGNQKALYSQIEEERINILPRIFLQKLLDFIDENKEQWTTAQCICDYFVQFDLYCDVLHLENGPKIFFICQIKSVEECHDKQDIVSLALGQHQKNSDWSSSKGNMSSSFSDILSFQNSQLQQQQQQQEQKPIQKPELPQMQIQSDNKQSNRPTSARQEQHNQEDLASPAIRMQLRKKQSLQHKNNNETDVILSAGDVTPITHTGTSNMTKQHTQTQVFSSSNQNRSQSLISDQFQPQTKRESGTGSGPGLGGVAPVKITVDTQRQGQQLLEVCQEEDSPPPDAAQLQPLNHQQQPFGDIKQMFINNSLASYHKNSAVEKDGNDLDIQMTQHSHDEGEKQVEAQDQQRVNVRLNSFSDQLSKDRPSIIKDIPMQSPGYLLNVTGRASYNFNNIVEAGLNDGTGIINLDDSNMALISAVESNMLPQSTVVNAMTPNLQQLQQLTQPVTKRSSRQLFLQAVDNQILTQRQIKEELEVETQDHLQSKRKHDQLLQKDFTPKMKKRGSKLKQRGNSSKLSDERHHFDNEEEQDNNEQHDVVAHIFINQNKSQASSQNSYASSTDNEILRKMANSTFMPTPLRDFRFMMIMFSLAFLGLMLYFLFSKQDQIDQLLKQNSDSALPSQMTSAFGEGFISTFFLYQVSSQFPLSQGIYSSDIIAERQPEMKSLVLESLQKFSQIIAKDNNIFLQWSDSGKNYSGLMSPNNQKYSMKIIQNSILQEQFFTLFEINLYLMGQVRNIQDLFISSVIDVDSIFTLVLNSVAFLDLMEAILVDQQVIINDLQQTFLISNIIFVCIALAIFSSIMGCTMPILMRINIYQEKVLLLIARMNEDECLNSIGRLESCAGALLNTSDRWLFIEYTDLFFFDNCQERKKKKGNNESLLAQQRQQLQQTTPAAMAMVANDQIDNFFLSSGPNKPVASQLNQNQKPSYQQKMVVTAQAGSSQKNRSIALSSKIHDHKLSVISLITFFVVSCVLATLFFAIIVIIVQNLSTNITPSIKLNHQCFLTNIKLSKIVLFSEMISVARLLQESFLVNNYTSQKNQDSAINIQTQELQEVFWQSLPLGQFRSQLQASSEYLEDFKAEFSTILKQSTLFSEDMTNLLNHIFFSDLCQVLPCDDTSKGRFKEGVVGVLTSYKKMLISYQEVFFAQEAEALNSIEQILRYIHSSEHTVLITDAFDIPKQSIEIMINVAMEAILQTINSIKSLVNIYITIIGSFVLVLFLLTTLAIERQLQQRIIAINFILTMLPFEKWNEDITIHMLRQISSI